MSTVMLIWVVMFVAFAVAKRSRRRWRNWQRMGPYNFPQQGGPPWVPPQNVNAPRADLEAYVDSLESRVAQLEERLDFTERLVAGRPGEWKPELTAHKDSDASKADDTGRVKGEA